MENGSTIEATTASTFIVTIQSNFPTIFDKVSPSYFDLCGTAATRTLRHWIRPFLIYKSIVSQIFEEVKF